MSYSSRNYMVSKEEAERIRKREEERMKRFLEVNKRAVQFLKKYKEDVIKCLSENKEESR